MKKKHSKKKQKKKNGVKIRYNGHKLKQKQGILLGSIYYVSVIVSVRISNLCNES